MAGDKLKGLPQDALLQRVLQVFPHTCGELLLKAKVDSRCADVDRLTNCKGLYAFRCCLHAPRILLQPALRLFLLAAQPDFLIVCLCG